MFPVSFMSPVWPSSALKSCWTHTSFCWRQSEVVSPSEVCYIVIGHVHVLSLHQSMRHEHTHLNMLLVCVDVILCLDSCLPVCVWILRCANTKLKNREQIIWNSHRCLMVIHIEKVKNHWWTVLTSSSCQDVRDVWCYVVITVQCLFRSVPSWSC